MPSVERFARNPNTPSYVGATHGAIGVPASARTVYVSGQGGALPTGHLPADAGAQFRNALRNVQSMLSEAHMALTDVVKMTIYVVHRGDLATLYTSCEDVLPGMQPAVTVVVVDGLADPDGRVAVDVVACAWHRRPEPSRHLGSI